MIYIGNTEKKIWLRMKAIAQDQAYLPPQPDSCPYILLRKAENQFVGLAAYPKSEGVELYIIPIYEPGLKSKDIRSCTGNDLETAQKYAERLLTAAVKAASNC